MFAHPLLRLFFLSTVLLLGGLAQAEEPKPDAVYDFGKGTQGAVVRHDFKLTNSGTTPLVVGKVTTSCPCTRVVSSPQTIAPGKSGVISVLMTLEKTGVRQVDIAATIEGAKAPRIFVIKGEVWSAP